MRSPLALCRAAWGFASFLVLSHCGLAQGTPPATHSVPPALASTVANYATTVAKIEQALAQPGLQHAIVGVLVRSLDTGAVVYEHNADLSLNPASCEKLFTGSTALLTLGPGFQYHTSLLRTGTIDAGGTLHGDVYLQGDGDPSLTSDDLLSLAIGLHNAGVRHLEGHIFADASKFDAQWLGTGWQWEDEPFEYDAEVAALNCDENIARIDATAALAGPPLVTLDGAPILPALFDSNGVPFLTLRTVVDATAKRTRVERSRGRNEILIIGPNPVDPKPVSTSITIDNPPLFAAYRLMTLFRQAGIDISMAPVGGTIGVATVPVTGTMVVAEHDSHPLTDLLTHCWKISDNLYAEAFLKTIGAQKGADGSSSGGARVVATTLQSAGIDIGGASQVDGSGLSRHDLVTARGVVDLLAFMDKKPAAIRDIFRSALPIAGVDGTLRNRMKGTTAQGRVQGKTGTLSNVTCLSGFATGQRSGERFAFSVLVNHYSGGGGAAARALQDTVGIVLTDR